MEEQKWIGGDGEEVRDESQATFIELPPKPFHHQHNMGTVSRRKTAAENAYF
jgi:hypothetical protein